MKKKEKTLKKQKKTTPKKPRAKKSVKEPNLRYFRRGLPLLEEDVIDVLEIDDDSELLPNEDEDPPTDPDQESENN